MKRLICLDPGHGGEDPGATAAGVKEKDIVWNNDPANLGVAQRIGHHLRAAGYDVINTRDSDKKIGLGIRARIAIQAGAKMFISVHCNAAQSPQGHGIEIFISTRAKRGERAIAEGILQRIIANPASQDIVSRGVKTANFTVISNTYRKMPAMLIECGFVTNAEDRAILLDKFYREAIAEAVTETLVAMLPPQIA